MRPGVLLPDPVWNLALVRWMDLRTTRKGMMIELRERQPKTARPKTVAIGKLQVFPGVTLPSSSLNPSRDGTGASIECQAFYKINF